MANFVVTPTFRANFPALFEQKLNKLSNKMEYSVVAVFPKGTDLSALKKAAADAIAAKWPDLAKRPKNLKNPFRKHEERKNEETGAMPEGYEEGGIFINLKSEKNKPQVVGPDKVEIRDESEIYSGVWMRASVKAYAYQHASGNAGVSFGLGNIQKVKDGDPLGSRTRAQDDFEPIAGTAANGLAAGSADDLFS
jgi:hypothetical protein